MRSSSHGQGTFPEHITGSSEGCEVKNHPALTLSLTHTFGVCSRQRASVRSVAYDRFHSHNQPVSSSLTEGIVYQRREKADRC